MSGGSQQPSPALVCLLVLLPLAPTWGAQVPPRLAILDLAGDERGEVAALLRASAREREPQVSSLLCELVDEGQVRAAVRGAGYTGSLNLSREEARALGMSIGCEFYILGKVQIARRIVSATEFYYEALTGLFLVETRSGRLALFACSRAQAADETQARAQLAARLRQEWARYAAAIAEARDKSLTEAEAITRAPEEVIEVFTDAAAAGGLQPPVFYQRLKPAYTEEAGLAGITATVELEAVFQADGRVGAVEVVRWAGFGLDEAAVETVRQLRFKPAMRDGRPLSIRGLVHYNFRRTPTAAERQEELERLRRSLRPIRKGD